MKRSFAKLIGLMFLVVSLVIPLAFSTIVSAKYYAEWSPAAKIINLSTAGAMESCPFITKDGLSLYYASNVTDGPGNRDLYVSQRISLDSPWGTPQKLGSNINTSGADERCPYVTPDGHRLIFVRGTSSGDNFYMSTRQKETEDLGWSDSVPLDNINSAGFELDPWGFENEEGELILYFGSSRTGIQDIYQTTMDNNGNFSTPTLVEELSLPNAVDTAPVVRKDGLELYFTRLIIGSPSFMDIWVSTRSSTSEAWSAPVNLGVNINSSANDMRAALTWDGMNMVFSTTRDGNWDLYQSTRTKLTGKEK
jgi:hypothetical protein